MLCKSWPLLGPHSLLCPPGCWMDTLHSPGNTLSSLNKSSFSSPRPRFLPLITGSWRAPSLLPSPGRSVTDGNALGVQQMCVQRSGLVSEHSIKDSTGFCLSLCFVKLEIKTFLLIFPKKPNLLNKPNLKMKIQDVAGWLELTVLHREQRDEQMLNTER